LTYVSVFLLLIIVSNSRYLGEDFVSSYFRSHDLSGVTFVGNFVSRKQNLATDDA
jgi:hypothetical protein